MQSSNLSIYFEMEEVYIFHAVKENCEKTYFILEGFPVNTTLFKNIIKSISPKTPKAYLAENLVPFPVGNHHYNMIRLSLIVPWIVWSICLVRQNCQFWSFPLKDKQSRNSITQLGLKLQWLSSKINIHDSKNLIFQLNKWWFVT